MYWGHWAGGDSTDLPGVVFSAQPRPWTVDQDGPHFSPTSQGKEEGFLALPVHALELISIQGSAQGLSVCMSTWRSFHPHLQSISPPLCTLEESVSLFSFHFFSLSHCCHNNKGTSINEMSKNMVMFIIN